MNEILEILPFLIPLALAQYGLMAYALYHIFTHSNYKRGSRVIWVIVSLFVNFIGPILYFVFGKEDN
jgi:hypothetical protein